MGECRFAIESLPVNTPQLVAFLIALLEFVIVIIAYIVRETHRKKTFYGREDFEDITEEEKMEHEGAIMGKNHEELRIVQSADRTVEKEAGSIGTPSGRGVKVMMRRKKARSILSDITETPKVKTPADALTIRFTLDVDRTARGFEFINLMQKSLEEVDEFRNIRHQLTDDAEDRLCDFLVRRMRTILEESTQNKWVVHGVIQNKMWKVNGQENLLEQGGDIRAQQKLRITAQGPTTPIILLAYMTNYLTTLHTMSTMPSEKLPTVGDTIARSRGSRKKDIGPSSTSTKRTTEIARSIDRIKMRRRTLSASMGAQSSKGRTVKSSTTNVRTTATDTDTRSRHRSTKSTEKVSSDRTQSGN